MSIEQRELPREKRALSPKQRDEETRIRAERQQRITAQLQRNQMVRATAQM